MSLVGGCAGAFGTLRIGIGEDTSDTLDPAQGRTFGGRQIFAALCDKLFDLDQNAKVVGQLVTDWKVSDDGLTITLNLRPGVVFHDGTPFNAGAVKFNIERSLNLKDRSERATSAPSARSRSSTTTLSTSSRKSVCFLAQLADRAGMMLRRPPSRRYTAPSPMPRSALAVAPRNDDQDCVVFRLFANYRNKDAIHFDEIVYLPMPDWTVRLNNLLPANSTS